LYLISVKNSGFKKNALTFDEAFDNHGYHRLVYAVVNLHNHKHFSSEKMRSNRLAWYGYSMLRGGMKTT
jgi:hypothetical protein